MVLTQNLLRHPIWENEGGNISLDSNDDKSASLQESSDAKEQEPEKKSLGEKIHDALQDWSNDDKRDQEFDDTRV